MCGKEGPSFSQSVLTILKQVATTLGWGIIKILQFHFNVPVARPSTVVDKIAIGIGTHSRPTPKPNVFGTVLKQERARRI